MVVGQISTIRKTFDSFLLYWKMKELDRAKEEPVKEIIKWKVSKTSEKKKKSPGHTKKKRGPIW